MDVFEITHQTRPDSVPVFSKAAREQVTRLVAALAHEDADHDDASRARVSEARHGLLRVMTLDAAVKKMRDELDKAQKMVQDRFYSLEDDLLALRPNGLHTVPAKGKTNVQPQGQAQLPRPTTPTSVSAGGNPTAIGAVLPAGTAARRDEPETLS